MLPYAFLLFSLTVPREPFYYFSLHWQIVFILIGWFLVQASMVRASRGQSPRVIPCVHVTGHSGLLLLSRRKAACWDFITFILLDSAYFPRGLVHLTGVSCFARRPTGVQIYSASRHQSPWKNGIPPTAWEWIWSFSFFCQELGFKFCTSFMPVTCTPFPKRTKYTEPRFLTHGHFDIIVMITVFKPPHSELIHNALYN